MSIPGLDVAADQLEGVLDELGWAKAHVVGNSLGGWLAFELARRGRVLSVTGLAPAGLWSDRAAIDRRLRFWFTLWVTGARRSTPAMTRLLRFRLVRALVLYRLFGRPWRIPGDVAIGDARALAESAFDQVFNAEPGRSFTGGQAIEAPITVTWHSRDPLFDPRHCTTAELPPHTRALVLHGCGHVPTWDDPPLVLETIRATVPRRRSRRPPAHRRSGLTALAQAATSQGEGRFGRNRPSCPGRGEKCGPGSGRAETAPPTHGPGLPTRSRPSRETSDSVGPNVEGVRHGRYVSGTTS